MRSIRNCRMAVADYTLMEDVLAEYQDEEETEEVPTEAHHETVEAAVKAESAKLEAAKKDAGSELSNSANVTDLLLLRQL